MGVHTIKKFSIGVVIAPSMKQKEHIKCSFFVLRAKKVLVYTNKIYYF